MNENPMDKQTPLRPVSGHVPVCYITGAGFSAATKFSLPTAVGFLTREMTFRAPDEDDGFTDQPVGLRKRFKHLSELLDTLESEYGTLDKLNLETVMSELYVRAYGVGRSWEPNGMSGSGRRTVAELKRDYEVLMDYVVLRLAYAEPLFERCPLVTRFTHLLREQDSIVSLNYDTIVEQHLDAVLANRPAENTGLGCEARLDRLRNTLGPPGSMFGGQAPPMFHPDKSWREGVLAKLHGSLNWFSCPNIHCPNHSYIEPVGPWHGRDFQGLSKEECVHCGQVPRTVIIPPTAAKAFEEFPNLGLMWSQAYHALRRAGRWVFIGTSLAPTDLHLSALLRSSSRDAHYVNGEHLEGQVCIVDRSPQNVSARLLESVSPKLANALRNQETGIATFESVEDYIHAAKSIDAERPHLPPSA